MSRPEEVLDKALRPCSCAFGLSENLRVNRKCENHAALTALTDELAEKDARLKEAEAALRDIQERTHHARDDSHTAFIARRCREALSTPPNQEDEE